MKTHTQRIQKCDEPVILPLELDFEMAKKVQSVDENYTLKCILRIPHVLQKIIA